MIFVSSAPSTVPGAQLMDEELSCILSFHSEKAQLLKTYHFPSTELRTQTSLDARELSQLLIRLMIICISYSSIGSLGKLTQIQRKLGKMFQ